MLLLCVQVLRLNVRVKGTPRGHSLVANIALMFVDVEVDVVQVHW